MTGVCIRQEPSQFQLADTVMRPWSGKTERGGGITYVLAKKLTKTVALLLSALKASFWICVFGGSTPLLSLEIIVRGRLRSCLATHHQYSFVFPVSYLCVLSSVSLLLCLYSCVFTPCLCPVSVFCLRI